MMALVLVLLYGAVGMVAFCVITLLLIVLAECGRKGGRRP